MIERRTLLDVFENKQKTRVTETSLGHTLTPVLSEPSEEVVSSFLGGIERASSFLMDNTKDRIDTFLQNDLQELTGQDIVVELMHIESAMFEIEKTLSQLKVEADIVKMSYEDEYNDAYQQILEGTVKDRNAYAEGKTTKQRYLSFAKTSLYESLERQCSSLRRQVSLIEKLLWQGVRGA